MWKSYGMSLAFIVGTLAGVVVFWAPVSPHERPIDSMTACYIALSEDLAPLMDSRVTDIAAASPECAPPDDDRRTLDARPTLERNRGK